MIPDNYCAMHFAFPSTLQARRQKVSPVLPSVLNDKSRVLVKGLTATSAAGDAEQIKNLFPCLYGQKSVSFQSGEQGAKTPFALFVPPLSFPVGKHREVTTSLLGFIAS